MHFPFPSCLEKYILLVNIWLAPFAAWVFWDNIESVFHFWGKRISEVFTRRPTGESNRECYRDNWNPKSSTSAYTRKWWCAQWWEAPRVDCISRWLNSKKLLLSLSFNLLCTSLQELNTCTLDFPDGFIFSKFEPFPAQQLVCIMIKILVGKSKCYQ